MVMKFMPIFFSVIMFSLPAGLVVYILVNNILSIGQQWVIHRQNDDPDAAKKGAAPETSGSDGSGKNRK
jgi:YidC/Oxa1 family membrane protein insertase